MLGTIIGLLVIGLVAGSIARAVVPGKDALSVPQTVLLGIVGSIIGSVIALLIHDAVIGKKTSRA